MQLPPLSEEQQVVFDQIVSWVDGQQNDHDVWKLRLGGLAGTGKTTLIGHLMQWCRIHEENVRVATVTGKAVSVLQSKGVSNAQTLHSLLYNSWLDKKRGKFCSTPKDPGEIEPGLLIVDEASMVSTAYYDLLNAVPGLYVLYVGDHGQLEPVGDNPKLMENPDLKLEHIHRQAANNPIIAFAHHIREGNPPHTFRHENPGVHISREFPEWMTHQKGALPDQVLVSTNELRHSINGLFRKFLVTHPERGLVVGEKVICLKNCSELEIYNGQQFKVARIHSVNGAQDIWCDLLRCTDGTLITDIEMYSEQFGASGLTYRLEGGRNKGINNFDYGYAITAHKSQGSEWDHVMVFDGPFPRGISWDLARWRYTAATRAAKQLTWVLP